MEGYLLICISLSFVAEPRLLRCMDGLHILVRSSGKSTRIMYVQVQILKRIPSLLKNESEA